MSIELDMWILLKNAGETHEEKYKEEIINEEEIARKEDSGLSLEEYADSIKNNPEATVEEINELLDLSNTFYGRVLTIVEEGFFRVVYDLGDRVLKVMKFGNNELNEYEADNKLIRDFPDLIPKVLQRSSDYSWIVQEKVEELDENEWFKLFHFEDEDEFVRTLKMMIEAFKIGRPLKGFPRTMTRMALYCAKYNVRPLELREENLGYTIRDGKKHPVLFDAGIFKKV